MIIKAREKFKSIKNIYISKKKYSHKYSILEISNYGTVRFKYNNSDEYVYPKYSKNNCGYLRVNLILYSDIKCVKHVMIHRLVCSYWNDSLDKPIVNHINGDKLDNYYKNLEWCTIKENTIHAYNNNLISVAKGEKVHSSRLTEDMIINDIVPLLKNKVPYKEISNIINNKYNLNIWPSTISNLLSRRSWTHIKELSDLEYYR